MEEKIKLSNSEWKLMTLLWERAPRTITGLTEALRGDTGWSKHTVITLLSRMEGKGAVHYTAEGRAKQYYPSLDRDKLEVQETESFLDRVYRGSLGLMVNTLISQDALSDQELQELYDILQEHREEGH